MKQLVFIIFFFIITQSKVYSSSITYSEILDNPTDLELNLNYAKQQEKTGNVKSTIATLERLSMLYPKNTDIKLYLLSILLKMDSKVKVDFMVKTMLDDPNTTSETKNLIAELLLNKNTDTDKEETKKWIAYMDFNISQTEEDNISSLTKSGKKAVVDESGNDAEVNYGQGEKDDELILDYDKTYVRGTSLTLGRILNQSSSLFMNLGTNINTNNKKKKGESDVHSGSISYFKAFKNHYFSPYVYYNNLNYRQSMDYQSRGLGINNTYLINNKFNINYALSFSDSRYHSRSSPFIQETGERPFVDAGDLNNNEVYSSSIRLNYNLSNKTQLSTRLIYNETQHAKNFDSYESSGANVSVSKILPLGTFTASATHLTNVYNAKKLAISTRDREDTSLVTSLSLRGDVNQIFPILRNINKDSSLYYTLNYRESNVNSTISSYEVLRSYKTIGLSKRINFND